MNPEEQQPSQIEPPPPAEVATVTCPSCASEYNPVTHELLTDTGLPVQVRELETTITTLRGQLDDMNKLLEIANAAAAAAAVPAPKAKKEEREFFVY